ncbi:ABC transporter ATP-binding protein [Paenibacillus sp. TRM 82003]|uniref:ABC transporter ATP-binding protein n=1 Tax=Kineococcus sp. TRM81007 TaxID=2925831 RepID=UPI001F58E40E|nr:ABC transporter ATP-binding protein [Kineococcus sp. TRM81007]MCI2238449.1 ABC transporter ATP-binding protein [Kineococcus sp. TRM81007]MCI3922037.1 ABC transporter ATP-binding protein [Paenibacillus sp. TRM 82003]
MTTQTPAEPLQRTGRGAGGPAPAAVEVRDLRRTHASGAEAVRGISFTVQPGEVFGLLGTNGAGKTSTTEVVAGLAAATSGTVRVLGHDPVRERRRVRPRTGVVLQSGGLPGDLTVTEAATTWAATLTAARPVGDVLDVLDLTRRASTTVKSLSGGERRRLDLAVALLGDPDLLLLDEPTTGLDAESRRAVWDLVRDLSAAGTAVLLTTHHLEEAEHLADRLAVMHRGLVVAEGTVADVVATHRAEVRWHRDAGRPDDTALAPGDAVSFDGRHVVVRTASLQRTLARVLAWADAQRLELPELRATPASLETAFLALARSADETR